MSFAVNDSCRDRFDDHADPAGQRRQARRQQRAHTPRRSTAESTRGDQRLRPKLMACRSRRSAAGTDIRIGGRSAMRYQCTIQSDTVETSSWPRLLAEIRKLPGARAQLESLDNGLQQYSLTGPPPRAASRRTTANSTLYASVVAGVASTPAQRARGARGCARSCRTLRCAVYVDGDSNAPRYGVDQPFRPHGSRERRPVSVVTVSFPGARGSPAGDGGDRGAARAPQPADGSRFWHLAGYQQSLRSQPSW